MKQPHMFGGVMPFRTAHSTRKSTPRLFFFCQRPTLFGTWSGGFPHKKLTSAF